MANHKDAIKRVRQTEKRRLHNRYYAKNMRNEMKKFRALTSKSEAESQLSKMYSIIDKVAKRGIIHKNKAANLKSKLTKFTNKLA
ncbi:MAG: 30S ribosomal protein S20 [Bacteroidales bacterium]|nr:30S ribosomal protein S20 [Bacteroidales bacterium]MBR1514681.1 30S ribosomal protein S20 [Bacteroidales bacterium]